MFAFVHAQTASTTAETVALRTIFATIALLAEQFTFVFGGIGGIQTLMAESAFEATLVPFLAGSQHFFGGIDRFVALRAFWTFRSFERHVC